LSAYKFLRLFYKLHNVNTFLIERVCPSACFVSETIQQISMKFTAVG